MSEWVRKGERIAEPSVADVLVPDGQKCAVAGGQRRRSLLERTCRVACSGLYNLPWNDFELRPSPRAVRPDALEKPSCPLAPAAVSRTLTP